MQAAPLVDNVRNLMSLLLISDVRNAIHAKPLSRLVSLLDSESNHVQVRNSKKKFECNLLGLNSPISSPPVLKLHSTLLWV